MNPNLGGEAPGQTALDEDDQAHLIPKSLATRADLDAAETANIARAIASRPRPAPGSILDPSELRRLHRAMFGEVWQWAGRYRIRTTNIGIAPYEIATQVQILVDDARMWIEAEDLVVVAVRLHHRLTQIHPFPNGNGRHARHAADELLLGFGERRLPWGTSSRSDRDAYLAALRVADDGDLGALVDFARGVCE